MIGTEFLLVISMHNQDIEQELRKRLTEMNYPPADVRWADAHSFSLNVCMGGTRDEHKERLRRSLKMTCRDIKITSPNYSNKKYRIQVRRICQLTSGLSGLSNWKVEF